MVDRSPTKHSLGDQMAADAQYGDDGVSKHSLDQKAADAKNMEDCVAEVELQTASRRGRIEPFGSAEEVRMRLLEARRELREEAVQTAGLSTDEVATQCEYVPSCLGNMYDLVFDIVRAAEHHPTATEMGGLMEDALTECIEEYCQLGFFAINDANQITLLARSGISCDYWEMRWQRWYDAEEGSSGEEEWSTEEESEAGTATATHYVPSGGGAPAPSFEVRGAPAQGGRTLDATSFAHHATGKG